jgi:hypothetical protein
LRVCQEMSEAELHTKAGSWYKTSNRLNLEGRK